VPTTPTKDLLYPATSAGGFALTKRHLSTSASEIVAQSAGNQSVSRDGTRVVYFDYDTGELWKADGTRRERLTSANNFGAAVNGPLSPDGRILAGKRLAVARKDCERHRAVPGTGTQPGVGSSQFIVNREL
jgi:hypothetical protein